MSDEPTPICDLIERLLSTGLSPGDTLDAARIVERAGASRRGSTDDQRERQRLKKQRQRARLRGDVPRDVPGDKPLHISSSSLNDSKKKKVSKESTVPPVPGDKGTKPFPDDDWPKDYGDLFWTQYPEAAGGRKRERAKVYAKLERLRREGYVDHAKLKVRPKWADLIGGLKAYCATEPEPQYVPAPLVWLNGHRWLSNYTGGLNGKKGNGGRSADRPSAVAAAAARRFGRSGRNGPVSGAGNPSSSAAGLEDAAERARRSNHPAFDTDDGFGPAKPV